MGRVARVAACAGGVALSAGTCAGGTIRADRLDSDYRAYAAQPQFACVGSYTSSVFGSVTLIAPDWALTAAHVVDANLNGVLDETVTDDSLVFGGVTRHPTQVFVPAATAGNGGWNGNINNGFDIALVHLNQPVTTVTPARLYTSFQELGKTVTMVGFGQGGTGLTGATGSAGTKRAGDNVVDQFVTFANGLAAMRWDFDEPAPRVSPNQYGSTAPLNMEYLIGPGDSGGGSFIFESDGWYLAGVHSGTYDLYAYPGAAGNTSTYGDAALVTRVAAYQDFIFSHVPSLASEATAVVPEPAALVAAPALLLVATARRRGRV
jgi:hypothetical protein